MKPINPKKRWQESFSKSDEPPDNVATAAAADATSGADDITADDDDDERVSDVSQGVARLTIDLEQAAQQQQQQHLAAAAPPETPPPLPPTRPPSDGPPPIHPPPCGGRSSHLDLGRLQPGQNALITSETLISRVVSVVPVSEPSSSAGSSPFR